MAIFFPHGFVRGMKVITHAICITINEIDFFERVEADRVIASSGLSASEVIRKAVDTCSKKEVHGSNYYWHLKIVDSEHLVGCKHISIHFPSILRYKQLDLAKVNFRRPVVSVHSRKHYL